MRCPRCEKSVLVVGEHNGILIFMCPDCCGVWLDREAIDKLIIRVKSEWEKRED
ncbi:MAG: hypothetical protein GY847_07895 [Proteobacteria bacterium]|nr:hypothetical protein [Pseudomonadota bacterium]